MNFGDYFKQLRIDKNFTQEEVAAMIGKSKMLVSGVETGRNDAFIDDDLEKLSVAFCLSRDERSRLFFEASKARNRFPSFIQDYLAEHEDAYKILEYISRENLNSESLSKIKNLVEDYLNVENG